MKTWTWTATIVTPDGKHGGGSGHVEAPTSQAAAQKVADWVQQQHGARAKTVVINPA